MMRQYGSGRAGGKVGHARWRGPAVLLASSPAAEGDRRHEEAGHGALLWLLPAADLVFVAVHLWAAFARPEYRLPFAETAGPSILTPRRKQGELS